MSSHRARRRQPAGYACGAAPFWWDGCGDRILSVLVAMLRFAAPDGSQLMFRSVHRNPMRLFALVPCRFRILTLCKVLPSRQGSETGTASPRRDCLLERQRSTNPRQGTNSQKRPGYSPGLSIFYCWREGTGSLLTVARSLSLRSIIAGLIVSLACGGFSRR